MLGVVMKKGQYFSFDAIIAAVIFVASISLLTTYWFGVRAIMDARSNDLFGEALRVSDSLLTPGNPPDWENDVGDAKQIGFTVDYRGNVLDESKVEEFEDFVKTGDNEYDEGKNLLHIVDDYYITVIDDQSIVLHEIGMEPDASAKNIANANRAAILDDELVTLRVQLWNNRTTG
jgi:hypothetical protein